MEQPQMSSGSNDPTHNTGGLFQFGPNSSVIINGGHFIQHNRIADSNSKGLVILESQAAPSAFHDSAQRVDPPKCHPNTRNAVLSKILDWVLEGQLKDQRLLWLNGAAGAGKSAIAQSLAELCQEHGILVASFFFFRTDSTRNSLQPLVPTLVYQIIQLLPESIRATVIEIINANPLIFKNSVETQIKKLIVEPLQLLQHMSGSDWRMLLICDGIDECHGLDNQKHLIQVLAKHVAIANLPLFIMFGSRVEAHLTQAFRSPSVFKFLLQLPLDSNYLPDEDIRVFLTDGFENIKQTHHFSHLLDQDWPAPALVKEIVDKSSGQFIYAAVVMKFISIPRSNPQKQLEIVRGLRPLTGHATPFVQLDALYTHIFSQIESEDIDLAMGILAYTLLVKIPLLTIGDISKFFDVSVDEVYFALADLTSVIALEGSQIRFLHASIPDFLFDPTRSKEYHINPVAWIMRLTISTIQNAVSRGLYHSEEQALINLLRSAECSAELREAVLSYQPPTPSQIQVVRTMADDFFSEYLTAVKKLDFGDDGEVYRQQLNRITRYLKKLFPDQIYKLQEGHDISWVLEDIKREQAQSFAKT